MRKNVFRKKAIRSVAIMLTLTMLISGCGKKEDDFDVDYYGGTAGNVSGSEEASGDTEGDSEEDTAVNASTGKDVGNLAERLGGENLQFDDSINVNGAVINFKLSYTASTAIQSIPTFKGSPIRDTDVKEEEIVNNLFGDKAVALTGANERKFTENSDENSELLISDYQSLVFRYNVNDEYVNYSNLPSWQDKDDCYYHTYEGEYLGIEYQLLISYSSSFHTMTVLLYPKDLTKLAGDDAIDAMTVVNSNGIIQTYTNGAPNFVNLSDATDSPNECQKSDEELLEQADEILKNKMNIYLPEGALTLNSSTYMLMGFDKHEADDRAEIIYYNDADFNAGDYSSVRRNGYATIVRYGVNGIPLIDSLDSITLGNPLYGTLFLDDRGILGASMPVSYNCGEMITEDSTLISFDRAMEAMESAIQNEANLNGTTKLEFNYLELDYFPVKSPDDPNEYTFVPAWVAYGNNRGEYTGRVVINAIDGSFLQGIFE